VRAPRPHRAGLAQSVLAFLLLLQLAAPASAAQKAADRPAQSAPAPTPVGDVRWLPFPGPHLELRGLPWYQENAPELWRLPRSAQARIPLGAWRRAVASDGARIRLSSTTSRLAIRVQTTPNQAKPCFIDAYVDGQPAGAAKVLGAQPAEFLLFEAKGSARKAITIYLPNNHEIRVLAVGVDPDADLSPPPAFARPDPVVCYGSSVMQGTGSAHPAHTYPAAMARRLNLDFVNLGFGGAGKAEPAVVELVSQIKASCFIFDLGKSYGNQDKEPYARMLATIRAAHPRVPLICVTPIYSTNEPKDPAYLEKSIRLRNLMREAAQERRQAGDPLTFVVEGLDLFGPADQKHFRDPQHPNDDGNELMAQRLAPIVERVLQTGKQ
jgi:lysophospholipase L1-like esterase